MKKIILTMAAVFAVSYANAQEVKFGAKAGLNVSNLTSSDGSSSLVGLHVGALAEIKVSDKFAVQPEVLYSMQGAKYDGGDLKMDYINVPVMAKYFVADKFNLQAGPQIGFLMSAKADGTDVKEFFKSTDFGLNLGAGYNVTDNIMVEARYNLGLSQVQESLSEGESKSMNSVIQLSIGYKF